MVSFQKITLVALPARAHGQTAGTIFNTTRWRYAYPSARLPDFCGSGKWTTVASSMTMGIFPTVRALRSVAIGVMLALFLGMGLALSRFWVRYIPQSSAGVAAKACFSGDHPGMTR
jgi:hypothetical protein